MNSLAIFVALASSSTSFYIGTYTAPNGSQGIYRATLNSRTGALSIPVLVAKTKNPSYLALRPNGRALFSVDESDHGSVSSYRIGHLGKLKYLNTQPVLGPAPCYLSVDPTGKNLLVASYGVGFISDLQIHGRGWLTTVKCQIQNHGTGPDKDRQDQSHMHWIETDRRDRFLYTCDLGTDKVQQYAFHPRTGLFSASGSASSPGGAGSRHGAFGRSGRFLYVANEMAESVSVFRVDKRSGALHLKQTIGALLGGGPRPGSSAAEIELHPNGRWLYVSNRGDDSISVFRVGRNGMLSFVQNHPAGVRIPRGFAIDPTGRWLVVGGQKSDNLLSLPISRRTGKLGKPRQSVSIDAPVCVLFSKR